MTKIDKNLLDSWKPYLDKYNLSEKDVKSHIEECYPNGQVKMIIHYVGDWDTLNHSMLGHSDYDEDGNLMKFDSSEDRFSWLNKMRTRAIDMQVKDYPSRWECALAVRKMIAIGSLDVNINEGYKWAGNHCSVDGKPITWTELKKSYENAKQRTKSGTIIDEFEEEYY
jgi:hypothetical protein|tara:strand:+ start:96 stop:599 length:504 start_codon:yes stop_codon:yes gene_type:complete